VQAVEVVAEGRSGERPPAVVAGEGQDAGEQPVQLEVAAEAEVNCGHRLHVEAGLVGDLHDVQRREHRAEARDASGERAGNPSLPELLGAA
jgi:hypothetical protein